MRRLLVSLFLLGSCLPAHAQDVKPYLRIETVSHTGEVQRIDVDAAEQFLVSASTDKTARVWDLHSGKLLQILRPPIGDFQAGMLYAVAISPDGKTVAVGGFTGAAESKDFPIYIFDRASGTIRNVIHGLPDVTFHLAYSRNGRNLVAALGSNGIRIYETENYSEVGRDADYADKSYWVEFDNTGRLASASDDSYVRLYGPDYHLIAKQKPPGGSKPYSARFSPDGNYIAVGFFDSSRVDVLLAKDLSFQYSAKPKISSNMLPATSWSVDARTLCAAGQYSLSHVAPVLCWSDVGKGKLTSFPFASDTVLDLRALRDGGMAFAVLDGTVGVLVPGGPVKWRAAPETLDYRYDASFPRMSSEGNSVESRGDYYDGTERTNHTIRFSVQDRKLEVNPQPNSSLASPVTQGLKIEGWGKDEFPKLNGKPLTLTTSEHSTSLVIAPKQDSFVLGTLWNIYRFDRQGARVWQKSVPGAVWGVNISSDERFVVATLADGTMRWYSYDKGDEVLALFVDRDLKRWVAWTPDGFFTFDNGGDALIGYQINRGPDHAGDFVKVDQLREVFYRPDLIAQILKPGGVEAASAARNRVGDISKVLSAGLPPGIELVSVSPTEEPDKYLVQFKINDMGGGSGRIVYRIDGVEIEARDALDIKSSGANTINRYITVGSGSHTLAISARSANGKIEGTPSTAPLVGREPESGSKVSLYVVAAGISHYYDHSLDDGVKFASADADTVAATFHDQMGKGLYQRVNAVALPDSKATAKNIRDEVAKAAASIKPGDTFVLYLAGHGISVDGEYYFIPWEAEYTNQKDLLAKSLNREAIQDLLKQIHTNKSVLILDTCGSGAYVEARATTISEKAAIEKVATMSGRAVIAASNSEQMAMDGYQNHGVFTYALLEAFKDADSNAQGQILITRLAEYIQGRVPTITLEKWHYRQTPMSRIEGEPFPIAHKATN
jgi:WD40 repeat protein